MDSPEKQGVKPTARVVTLVIALLAAGSALLWLTALLPDHARHGMQIPWWVLALLFAATEMWVFYIQFGRETKAISISEIPLVLGLFYATEGPLMVARVLGPAAVVVLYRRQTPLKAVFNISLFYVNGAVAVFVFRLVSGGSASDGPRSWVAAVLACVLAICVDLAVLTLMLRWYTPGSHVGGLRRSLPAVVMAGASATVALVPVLALRLGPLATVPLVAAGIVLMLAYRSYSSLADRHTSLERLFRFSRELSSAPATTDVLPAVLAQARQLLHADVAEVLRFGGSAANVWRYDGRRIVTAPGETVLHAQDLARSLVAAGEAVLVDGTTPVGASFLDVRTARDAVLAPLTVEGETVGVLAVYDRQGENRGFADSDVRLLQTVANHASVALYNETLIGRLRHDALHDALTGLPNRSQLMALATSAVARATAGESRVAMLIIDLNGFKIVNDSLGHHVGDQLIRVVGERLSAAAGPGITVARLGGDEFAVLVEPAIGDCLDVAARLVGALEEPVRVDAERLHLSAAVGIALAPDHATGVTDLLKRADIAMYAAKNGPDPAVVYRRDIDLNDPSLLSLMGELREALASGDVKVEVQPVVELSTGRLSGAEALVRWHHPTRGVLAPEMFLPLAERNGLIIPLTELVLDRAVSACASWQREGLQAGISVNLSARSLIDQTLPGTVADVLRRHNLPSHLLTLEITESIVISDADRAITLLAELRALGVRLALDDFGTGYSSLTYLSALPIQLLKIDRSFVTRIVDSSRDSAIVTSLIDLSHHLGLRVIAEGVEDEGARDRLRRLGCDYAQGFLFARSMPPELLVEWARLNADLPPLPVQPVAATSAGSLRERVNTLIP